ncbi:phosphoheptose isomerase [Thermobispora bispora]|uniref:Phosphoheptose isomerase n=1 Tax=Thermobispora bispora (strain ATCC 19993 / DSM 43833 / CBS 139.67 / JCM 10125 / KCTC 9307 / NBRC 14880 / R51) TaxID=469371 RepID=D6Y5C3_THEBD|nr:SIS domain-containing protein [Thermobispora bispora]MBO2473603.1 SIS domain-containing protein [Actinomycetales bacterium]MDI9580993.1 SIS domain-containing protein [Thermobispora sp.]ADG89318.1 phosphoheptose isomerase [Thermobispora bispora DSM 43833]MBX6168541.1 SIS domain-containing protein [Thermobispora bispora]QSI48985.1 SIS domain-containing protein [Thermobispora bispora]
MATALATAAARRAGPGLAVTADAGRIARAAHAMAARFQRGGRLLTFGIGLAAADAAHVAVEFAHPAMAGRRALPAIPLAADACALTASGGNGSGPLTAQLRMLGRPHDIALGILGPGRPDGDVPAALAAAREIGMLTVALATGEHADRDPREDGTDPARASASPGTAATPLAAHLLAARSGDPLIVREIHLTIAHLLWELVHAFMEQPDLLVVEAPR